MKYDLTDLSWVEREKIFREEGRKPPVYITEDGRRISPPIEEARGPLKAPWPAPGVGLVDVYPDDEDIRRNVYAEAGRDDLSPAEYRDALDFLAREKGWRVIWPSPRKDSEAPAVAPQPVKRRGRPPGSKNKKKA